MNFFKLCLILVTTVLLFTGCSSEKDVIYDAIPIVLSDNGIKVNGEAISTDKESNVYSSNDIIYYEENKGFTYGEGSKEDEHTEEEAKEHTVINITKPGIYSLSGSLSKGQVAVDLGEEAKKDPNAVVTLVLDNVDITCSVAPAVIFYNVYECGTTENPNKDVDTVKAGANVIIMDETENNIKGSYVARIYKSYELNEEGTEVIDNKKLHKYDAAFYSKMSMNIDGGASQSGILNITAENEGLDSELHLTINGGNINITSGNDGINTNEDGVSVTTINGGKLNINVTGTTGEGDGIDSNGWLVINGGTVIAEACSISGDAGIDSDMGIHINGGTVIATGNMLDRISESAKNYVVFNFQARQKAGTYTLKNADNQVIAECKPKNDFSYLIISDSKLEEGNYTLWMGDKKLSGAKSIEGRGLGGMMPRPENGMTPPDGIEPPKGSKFSEGMNKPERGKIPEGVKRLEGEADWGRGGNRGRREENSNLELTTDFVIEKGGNYYSNLKIV